MRGSRLFIKQKATAAADAVAATFTTEDVETEEINGRVFLHPRARGGKCKSSRRHYGAILRDAVTSQDERSDHERKREHERSRGQQGFSQRSRLRLHLRVLWLFSLTMPGSPSLRPWMGSIQFDGNGSQRCFRRRFLSVHAASVFQSGSGSGESASEAIKRRSLLCAASLRLFLQSQTQRSRTATYLHAAGPNGGDGSRRFRCGDLAFSGSDPRSVQRKQAQGVILTWVALWDAECRFSGVGLQADRVQARIGSVWLAPKKPNGF